MLKSRLWFLKRKNGPFFMGCAMAESQQIVLLLSEMTLLGVGSLHGCLHRQWSFCMSIIDL